MTQLIRSFPSDTVIWILNLLSVLFFAVMAVRTARQPTSSSSADLPKRHLQILFTGILLLGAALRLFRLDVWPICMPEDEASIAYDAYCLATYGTDRYGFAMPVHMTAWGWGQSALSAYLAALSFRLFGDTLFALRLPQALLGIASLPAVYAIGKKAGGSRCGLWTMFLLAVSPWHIMMSRWNLDCNFAPAMIWLGLAFFVWAIDETPWKMLPACFFFGLALYSYAVSQIVLFLFLLAAGLWLLRSRKVCWKWHLPAAVLLGLMALPQILFLLVNQGILPQIVTPWFSVPKLLHYRAGELGAYSLGYTLLHLLRLMVLQYDGNTLSSLSGFGVFYLFMLPFFCTGLVVGVRRLLTDWKSRSWSVAGMCLLFFLMAFGTGLMVEPITWRCVNVWTGMLLLTALGLHWWLCRLPGWGRYAWTAILLAALALFMHTYIFREAQDIGYHGEFSAPEAVAFAQELPADKIYMSSGIYSSTNWVYDAWNRRLPPEQFVQNYDFHVGTPEDIYAYYTPSFGRMHYIYKKTDNVEQHVGEDNVAFVLSNYVDNIPWFQSQGFETKIFQHYTVAWKP